MQKELFVGAKFTAKKDKADDLYKALNALITPTRQEPGCLSYELYRNKNNPNVLTMIEKFKDEAASDFHCKQAYLRAFMKMMPELVESSSIDIYEKA